MEVNVNKQTKKVKVPFDAEKYDGTQKVVCRDNDYVVKNVMCDLSITDEYPVIAVIQDHTDVAAQIMTKKGKLYDDVELDNPLDLFFEIEEESEPEITIKCSKEELAFIGKCFGQLRDYNYNKLGFPRENYSRFSKLYDTSRFLGDDLLEGYQLELKVK